MRHVGKKMIAAAFATAFAAGLIAGTASAGSFELIRIGDVDGFGYGDAAGWFAANGGPANVDGAGVLGDGDYLPDRNGNGILATFQGDDFDYRSTAEIAGGAVEGAGFVNIGTQGSQFTDLSLSTSYDFTYPVSWLNDFPSPPSWWLPNQPGFVFDFFVADGDIAAGQDLSFNLIFGDYDVYPAVVNMFRLDGSSFQTAVFRQGPGNDGLVQAADATLSFFDVFTQVQGGWHGYLGVDFDAPLEPYTAFDFAELSVVVPEPATMTLLGIGLAGIAVRRFRKSK